MDQICWIGFHQKCAVERGCPLCVRAHTHTPSYPLIYALTTPTRLHAYKQWAVVSGGLAGSGHPWVSTEAPPQMRGGYISPPPPPREGSLGEGAPGFSSARVGPPPPLDLHRNDCRESSLSKGDAMTPVADVSGAGN